MTTPIYWDHNATTPVDPKVKEAMLPFLGDSFGNPSSPYPLGHKSAQAIVEARERTAAFLGARPQEILWSSGATESIATAFHAAFHGALEENFRRKGRGSQATLLSEKKRFIISAVEHSATLAAAHFYEQQGHEVVVLPVDRLGMISLSDLEIALDDPQAAPTALVSLLWANNETGVIFPIDKIAPMVADRGVPLHIDATQAVGKLPINLTKVAISYLSFSGHKFYGPKGIGALYLHRHAFFAPLLWGHQELGRRGGTENVPGIVGLGAAIAQLESYGWSELARQEHLRDQFEQKLGELFTEVRWHGIDPAKKVNRLPNTTHWGIAGMPAQTVLLLLAKAGVCCSTGSACSSASAESSHVLKAMGLDQRELQGSLRFSLGRSSSQAELKQVLQLLKQIADKLDW